MKKRRYADLYGYTQDEFDRWLESGIHKKLRSTGKSRSELDMDTVFEEFIWWKVDRAVNQANPSNNTENAA